jgi:hypothetical protein
MRVFLRAAAPCLLLLLSHFPSRADLCDPKSFAGPYAFQLSGETTIASDGHAQPMADLGRLVLDGQGGLSGFSSVAFSNVYLGNPVTGGYEAHQDCTVTWSLQDDSGGMQHFSGVITPNGDRVEFKQTDPGGASHGIMRRTSDQCKAGDLLHKYAFELSGSISADGTARTTVKIKGFIQPDSNGTLHLTIQDDPSPPTDVGAGIEDGCVVKLQLQLAGKTANFRGVLANGGREILAIQTDPMATVSARFIAQGYE